ncbi:MAG: hypothetical protein P4L90_20675 [Rhodopila sp.]|nr:hypothetical protein [Rhodopila sp.]
MRIAVVGHATWFANHYPENRQNDLNVLCLDVREGDYSWLIVLRNWRPDVTLFYRPELYPERFLRNIDGVRIAFLTEPLPAVNNGKLEPTAESALRLQVYGGMAWHAYHRRLYYDSGRAATAAILGWPVDAYRPMPIDTTVFHPPSTNMERPIDACFVGKATPHRIARLEYLRSSGLRFLWVAHGVHGGRLARLFRRSRVVLNVHADGVAAQEPRLYLAAACGCRVVTEPLSTPPAGLRPWIVEEPRDWTERVVQEHLTAHAAQRWSSTDEAERLALGVRRLLADEYAVVRPVFESGAAA